MNSKRQILARKRIGRLSLAINTAIDNLCKEENYDITYAEINAALLDTLTSNNGYELRSLWQVDKEDEK